jgi:hypothetical protein
MQFGWLGNRLMRSIRDTPRAMIGVGGSFASLVWESICESNEFMIAIVSGPPRAGTSLMMQKLVAGGVPAL